MNYKSLLTIILFMSCALYCTALIGRAENLQEKVICDISEKNHIIQIEEKIPLELLEKDFPLETEVTLMDGTVEIVPVTWKCEVDYEMETYDSYVFEIQFPKGYMLEETCESSFLMVVLNEASVPETRIAWDSNPSSSKRFDAYLGVTENVVAWLEAHEDTNYYLGTPYYGDLNYPKRCTRANGEYKSMGYDSAGMNCTGFVASVMRKLGGDLSKIVEYSDLGSYANAYNWHYTAHNKSIKSYRYTSISKMLAGGKLQKGDIIYFEPDWTIEGVDCHMGFFWGDSSDENKFWHSTYEEGNIISKIKSKSSYQYVYIFKIEQPGELSLEKSSANSKIIAKNNLYSLENAEFGVYKEYNAETGELNKEVGRLITNDSGKSNILYLSAGTYYVKEITAPPGYILNERVVTVTLESAGKKIIFFNDGPQASIVDILIKKIDKILSEDYEVEPGTLKDAEFAVSFYPEYYDTSLSTIDTDPLYSWVLKTDENGLCKMTSDYLVSGDTFITDSNKNAVIPLGTITIKEVKAPEGYEINEKLFIIPINRNESGNNVDVFQEIIVPEKKINNAPIIPATGDNKQWKIFVLLSVFSGITLFYLLRRCINGRKISEDD